LWSFTPSGFAKLNARAGDEAKIGFKVHPHMLRHACGYALANKGIDTRTLQAYLGTLDQLDHALCGVGPAAVKKIRGEGVAGAPRRSKIRTMVSTGVPTLAPRFAKLILENFS
jgi:Phage integrase family